jgi:hypothetical protein
VIRALLLGVAAAVTAPPLPSLPVLARVRIDVAPTHLVVTEDVRMARGEWTSGDLDLYVAFGAPGVPRAFDAHLIALTNDAFAPDESAQGEPVNVERTTRRPQRARLLLGREAMAGVVVHVKEPALRRAFAGSNALVLRLRSLVPTEGAQRDVVVRLGTEAMAIGAIELNAPDGNGAKSVARAEAKLCGPNADPYPLAVTLIPSRTMPITYPRPTHPLMALRHDGDDLCVRILAAPDK